MKRYDRNKFKKLYDKLNDTDERKNSIKLYVDGIISPEMAYKEIPKIYSNEVLVAGVADCSKPIPLHTKFEVIYPFANPREYVECEVVLKYINERHFILKELFSLHSADCILAFRSSKPEIIKQLGVFGKTGPNDDCLNFTTKALMNKIIEIMDEEGL
jgi:hypothetical protein